MRVRATKRCFIENSLRLPGKEFALLDPKHFNPKCMEKLDGRKPPAATNEPKKPETSAPTGSQEVI